MEKDKQPTKEDSKKKSRRDKVKEVLTDATPVDHEETGHLTDKERNK